MRNALTACSIAFAFGLNAAAQNGAPPTFSHDIAPLVFEHCASCHHSGGAGPFSLMDYADVRKHAREIAEATRSHSMPPYLPEAGYGDFLEDQRLTDAEVDLLSRWVSSGTPAGPPSELPPPPQFPDGWALGQPDLIVEAPSAISIPASGPDVFWNFVLTPDLKMSRYVRAIEIRTGHGAMVHHANLIVDPARSARKRERSPGAGFPGMDVTVERPALSFDSHFLFWKPGSLPYSEPKGFSWRLDPGTDLVLNTHIKPHGEAAQLRPAIGLYFTNDAPARFPMLIELDGDNQLNIPAGSRDFPVADDFTLPVDAQVLAVYPHAHYLGKLLEGFATLPDGTRKWLIRIPSWDQDVQAVYHLRAPLLLPKGSVISMRYHYDNSSANPHNPSHPPRRVRAGNQATDEMAHLWLQLLPRGPGDARPFIEEALMRHRIDRNPADFLSYLRLGGLLMARMNAADALPVLRTAVRIEPDHAEAHNLFGAALASVGQSADSVAQFQLALKIEPGYSNARLNLANALAKSGRFAEAAQNFRQLLQVLPDDELTKKLLARTLSREAAQSIREEKFSDALTQLDQALALDSSLADARQNRELVLEHLDKRR